MQNFAPSGFSVEQLWHRIDAPQTNRLIALVSPGIGYGQPCYGRRDIGENLRDPKANAVDFTFAAFEIG
jgi:hypothetical protein